jgi:hypothetical protein
MARLAELGLSRQDLAAAAGINGHTDGWRTRGAQLSLLSPPCIALLLLATLFVAADAARDPLAGSGRAIRRLD